MSRSPTLVVGQRPWKYRKLAYCLFTLFATARSTGLAQVSDRKAAPFWLPAGITEAELIRSVLPEYDEKLVRWEKNKVGAVESVGWEKDGRRIFAVVGIGEKAYAVLSFSSIGRDDYWEDLVASNSPLLDRGFVLARTDGTRRR